MSLRFICIEVRKNLHCANVFLQFDQSLTETEFLKIHVEDNAIRLKEYSTETCAMLQEHFAIEARTMSNLTVEECNASFRITIDKITEDAVNDNQMTNHSLETEPKPCLKAGELGVLHCKNCENAFTDNAQIFQRVLEFPSGSIDMSEFFCHHGPDFGQVLVPKAQDFFYGFQFIVLNMTLIRDKIKEKESHLYCRRCLQYLGEALFDGNAAKIWVDSVRLCTDTSGALNEVFDSMENNTPTYQLLQKIIRDCSVDNELHLHQMQFSKVLLEATFPNRQRNYLLLHILEKQLDILRNTKPLAHGSSINNNNVLQVTLKKLKCFKLLYRLMDESQHESNSVPLLTYWKQDISIHLLKISPTLFSELLSELEENSLLLPEIYRYTSDEFQLSYVFYNR